VGSVLALFILATQLPLFAQSRVAQDTLRSGMHVNVALRDGTSVTGAIRSIFRTRMTVSVLRGREVTIRYPDIQEIADADTGNSLGLPTVRSGYVVPIVVGVVMVTLFLVAKAIYPRN
jgi:hypothetical protein